MRNTCVDTRFTCTGSFELTKLAGKRTAGAVKDVMMLGSYREAEIEFVADNPGMTLFYCHQQLHMDFGFRSLFAYARFSAPG